MKKKVLIFLVLFILISFKSFARENFSPCPSCIENESFVCSDQIPERLVFTEDDQYFTGYVQALLDMHYYEFLPKVLIIKRTAYLFNMPNDCRISDSIVIFVRTIPGICKVILQTNTMEEFCEKAFCNSQNIRKNFNFFSKKNYRACLSCSRIIILPQNTVLFSPFIADPRQITNSACLRLKDDVVGEHVAAVSFGNDFIIARFLDVFSWKGDLDIGIQAGIFSVFDLDHVESCLVNTDFFVAGMITYAVRQWSWRFRLWHLSSHLGDEFLLTHPDYPRYNLSDEAVDVFFSYYYNRHCRLYGGIGYIYSRDKSFPEKPWYMEGGVELRFCGCVNREKILYSQPFLAMDFRLWEEHNFHIDQNYALGMEWGRFRDAGRKFRAFLEIHQGFSKEGQFIKQKSSYGGFKVTYGF